MLADKDADDRRRRVLGRVQDELAVRRLAHFHVLHFGGHGESEAPMHNSTRARPADHHGAGDVGRAAYAQDPAYWGRSCVLRQSSGVGKSALVRRYTEDEFLEDDEAATIGVDYKMKSIYVQGKWFKLSIWDTAGQERYRTLTSSYYRGAQGVIIVYDVTSQESFDALPSWAKELEMFTGDQSPVMLLVGNKTDQDARRVISEEQGAQWAKEHRCLFVECSAKENVHVGKAFQDLVQRIASTPALWQDVAPGVRRPGDRIPGGVPNAPGTISLSDASSYLATAQEKCGC